MSNLRDKLVAYYKLDGNSNDSVGSDNGTDTSITYGSAYGKINQGASFNGSSSIYLSSNLGSFTDITVACWIKTSQTTQGRFVEISNGPTAFEVDVISNKARSTVYTGSIYNCLGTSTINDNNWHLIVAVRDGSNSKIYVDGSLETTVSCATTTIIGIAAYTCFGRHFTVTSVNYNGYLDEIGIWSRALSADEVSQLFNSGRGLSYPFIKPNIFKRISKYIGSATSSFNPAIARRRLLLRK